MEIKEDTVKRANFKSFAESTREDWELIVSQREPLISALPGRVIQQLELLRDDFGGFPVDRLEHSLQTCLLYTSPSPRDAHESRMPSSA